MPITVLYISSLHIYRIRIFLFPAAVVADPVITQTRPGFELLLLYLKDNKVFHAQKDVTM